MGIAHPNSLGIVSQSNLQQKARIMKKITRAFIRLIVVLYLGVGMTADVRALILQMLLEQIKSSYLFASGQNKSDREEYEGAFRDFYRARWLDPNDSEAEAFTQLADFYLLDNSSPEIEACSQAIQQEPNNPVNYHNRGYAKSEIGDLQGAIEDYSIAIKLHPSAAETYCNRGYAYLELGNKEKSLADLQIAAQLWLDRENMNFHQALLEDIKQLQMEEI